MKVGVNGGGLALCFCLVAASAAAQTVRVSDFGCDADDSTRFIQKALDSGAQTVVLDRRGSPWMTDSLRMRSNTRLVFEPGVELCARKGGLVDTYATLVSFEAVTNAAVSGAGGTVRLRREDYVKAPYRESQHRHAFASRGGVNVTIEGLTVIGAGGDGVYVCADRNGRPTRNLTVRDVTVTNSYRQGMSVISVKGLRLERVKLLGTHGSSPEAGIDFEPNYSHELLQDIVIRDTLVAGNVGNGFGFSLWKREAGDPPVDARFENCRVEGSDCSVFYLSDSPHGSFPRGNISFRNCTFASAKRAAVRLSQKPKEAVAFRFEDCRAENCGGKLVPEILLYPGLRDDPPADGIDFGNFTIVRGKEADGKAFIDAPTGDWMPAAVMAITGRMTIEAPSGKKTVALDDAWRTKTFRPASEGETPARYVPDFASLEVRDDAPGEMREMTAIPVRFKSRWMVWADRPRKVRLAVRQEKVSKYRPTKNPVRVYHPSGRKLGEFPTPSYGQRGEISFEAPARGLYVLVANVWGNAFAVTAADAPVALDLEALPVQVMGMGGTAWFAAPDAFALFTRGTGSVKLSDPSGRTCAAYEGDYGWNRCLGQGVAGLFSLTVGHEKGKGRCGALHLDLLGAPCHLFPNRGRVWTSARRVKTVRAADFGFRGGEATKALKSALASDAGRVYVGVQDNVVLWSVGAIRQPACDKEVIFEDGVLLRTKKGAFEGVRDCLLDLSGSTNLVVRGYGAKALMWKGDYSRPPYRPSADRHAIRLSNCANVTVEGLLIERPGNAGVQVGPKTDGAVLRDLVIDQPTGSAVQNLTPYSRLRIDNVQAR